MIDETQLTAQLAQHFLEHWEREDTICADDLMNYFDDWYDPLFEELERRGLKVE